MRGSSSFLAFLGVLFLAGAGPDLLRPDAAHAQIGDRLKRSAQRKAEDRVVRRGERAIDKGLDATEGAITCAITDEACIERGRASGREVVVTDARGNRVDPPAGGPGRAGGDGTAAAPGVFKNFDFVPGNRILFEEDFANEAVGNFPRRLGFKSGNAEVATSDGRRWLTFEPGDEFEIRLKDPLPERFTLEFDWVAWPRYQYHENVGSLTFGMIVLRPEGFKGMTLPTHSNSPTGDPTIRFSGYVAGIGGRAYQTFTPIGNRAGQVSTIRLLGDGDYLKMYVNGIRVANVPTSGLQRSRTITFRARGEPAPEKSLIGNIRVAAGGKRIYDALLADGRVAVQGILFDTGSDRIRPESAPTLREIGEMLQEHADLKLAIEGHTDNVGAAAANQALSEKRAAAVRAALLRDYGVDGARLVAKGYGASRPAAANDTPEGRQQNRRVELVRQP